MRAVAAERTPVSESLDEKIVSLRYGGLATFAGAIDLRSAVLPSGLLVAWEACVRFGLVDPLFLPAPSSMLTALWEVALTGELWVNIGASLWRIACGYLIAAALAIPLGLALGYSANLRVYLNGLLELLRPVPPIALIPVSILWLGIDNASKIAIIAYACFWPLILNVVLGVEEIPQLLQRAARTMDISGYRYFTKIMLPAALPKIIVGLRISAGLAFVVVVAAEMVAASSGLGYMILDAERTFRSGLMFGGIVLLSILGFLLNKLLVLVERRIVAHRM